LDKPSPDEAGGSCYGEGRFQDGSWFFDLIIVTDTTVRLVKCLKQG